MLSNLTQVANYKRLRYVSTEKLVGKKYAVKFKERDEFFVSPAVYDLIKTDLVAVAQVLEVRELPGSGWSRRS